MKLHDLRPADGAHRPRKRVGRGIAAGGGKTAGRGTKGQKARTGGSIPPWFEGGQTPLHMRIPKLRGFRNPFKVEYEVVNVGAIAALVEAGELEAGAPTGAKGARTPAPITVNQEILRATGLVRTLDKPLKILGTGDLSTPLFVVADAFSRAAGRGRQDRGRRRVGQRPRGPGSQAAGTDGHGGRPVRRGGSAGLGAGTASCRGGSGGPGAGRRRSRRGRGGGSRPGVRGR
jgi:large subunit ribosomal protein L15